MTEPRSPDDEPIIELTEVVEPSATGDDDIIELTEVVESASTADEQIIELTEVVDSAPAADEDIIELTDVVEPESAADEEIVELTDIVEPARAMDEGPSDLAVVENTPAAEGDIIDLVDVVGEAPQATAAENEESATAEDGLESFESEDVPELADDLVPDNMAAQETTVFDLFDESALEDADTVASPDTELDFAPMDLDIEEKRGEDLFDSLGMKLEPDLKSGDDHDELDFNLSTQELSDAIDLLDAKLAEEPPGAAPVSMASTGALSSSVSQAQVEKALENVIRKMYAEKIDLLLNEAIEKNVSAEIKRLKEQLLTDSSED